MQKLMTLRCHQGNAHQQLVYLAKGATLDQHSMRALSAVRVAAPTHLQGAFHFRRRLLAQRMFLEAVLQGLDHHIPHFSNAMAKGSLAFSSFGASTTNLAPPASVFAAAAPLGVCTAAAGDVDVNAPPHGCCSDGGMRQTEPTNPAAGACSVGVTAGGGAASVDIDSRLAKSDDASAAIGGWAACAVAARSRSSPSLVACPTPQPPRPSKSPLLDGALSAEAATPVRSAFAVPASAPAAGVSPKPSKSACAAGCEAAGTVAAGGSPPKSKRSAGGAVLATCSLALASAFLSMQGPTTTPCGGAGTARSKMRFLIQASRYHSAAGVW
mmetsp:Transcript_82710/g.229554  ORF Transcript_82710/g.229554 Transcript_82710/m.229554 type:complete len:326 (+) Transcript_82710:36-1013(+)